MEIKFTLNFCFKKNEKYLFGKRSECQNEYPEFWSLPSLTIEEETYFSQKKNSLVSDEKIQELFRKKFKENLPNDCFIVRNTQRIRDKYKLYVLLCLSESCVNLSQNNEFNEFSWLTINEMLDKNTRQTDTCLSLLIQEEIEHNNVRQNIDFIEINPEMMKRGGKPIEEWTDEELWLSCAPNYSLLKEGFASSDGDLIREVSLDKFIKDRLTQLPLNKKMIDIGCGNGELVSYLNTHKYSVFGFDLSPNLSNKFWAKEDLYSKGKIGDISTIYYKKKFDVIILNLVCNWIENLEDLTCILKDICSTNALLYITITVPEFSKNGTWNRNSEKPQWIIEQPIRRSSFLTMINRGVGPVRFHPHSTPKIITTFAKANWNLLECQHIFLDTMTKKEDLEGLISKNPYLERHIYYPAFIYFQFTLNQ